MLLFLLLWWGVVLWFGSFIYEVWMKGVLRVWEALGLWELGGWARLSKLVEARVDSGSSLFPPTLKSAGQAR